MRFWEMPLVLCLLVGVWLCVPASAEAQVQLGNEVLAAHNFQELAGKRVGLLTNPSGVNRKLLSTIDVLHAAPGVKLVALFGAEHGIDGKALAGKEILNSVDARTGLPVYSLYGPGPTRKPTTAMLKGIDALVYDIQDTGCRSYTYISTMGLAMEACAENGVEFIVLDRPNPLGGLRVEGPRLNPKFRSLVGQWNIPYVYGLTCGELARLINGERFIQKRCKLTVIPMKGWRRWMIWQQTGLPWVPTSPNIPRSDSPMFQVATGMLGEIGGSSGLNIGIHTEFPFQFVAVAWLDANKTCQLLNNYKLPGLAFKPMLNAPSKSGERMIGTQIHVLEPQRAPLTAINFYFLEAIRRSSGRDLFREAVKAGQSFNMFDKVNGTDATRRDLQAGRSARNIVNSWKAGEESFRNQRATYLLY